MGRGRGGITLAEALPLAVLAVVCTNLLLERFPRTSCAVQGGRGGWSLQIITVTLSTSFAGLGAGQPCTHCGILLQDINQIKLLLPPSPLYPCCVFLLVVVVGFFFLFFFENITS